MVRPDPFDQPAPGDHVTGTAELIDQHAPATVLTSRRARATYTPGFIRAQVAGRRWTRVAPGLFVTHNGELTADERLWVALLSAPAGSVLGGTTAAVVDGLTGFEPEVIDLVIPHHARSFAAQDGTRIHRSAVLDGADLVPMRAPRRTRPARSIIDAASWSTSERLARVLVLAAVQQRLVRPEHLQVAMDRRGRFARRGIVRESIVDAAGGIQSLPELEFARMIRRAGLPEPTRQQVLRRSDGRYFLDAGWPEYDAACEIQGIPHLRVGRWEADMSRSNEIMIAGPRLLSFSSHAIRHHDARALDQLRRLLRRGGWPG